MFGNLSGPTLLVILFIVLLLFGAPKLPALARSLGQSMRILKKEVRTDETTDAGSDAASSSGTPGTTTKDAANEPAPRNDAPRETPPGTSNS